MKIKNRDQLAAAGMMLAAGVLCAALWAGGPGERAAGENDFAGQPQETAAGMQPGGTETSEAGQSAGIGGTGESAGTGEPEHLAEFDEAEQLSGTDGASEKPEPELSQGQRQVLDGLAEYLGEKKFEEAARLILDQGDLLSELYYETMSCRKYLYRDGRLHRDLEGSGLVLVRTSLVFLGNFAEGCPEGECMGFQAIELDHPRYDFAEGSWKSGRMNGRGRIGYCYFEGAGEENLQAVREGTFLDDGMDGEVALTTVNAEGEASSWSMRAEAGTLVLDDAWIYDESSGAYQLPSDEDSGHAYVVTSGDAAGTVFRNLLLWE